MGRDASYANAAREAHLHTEGYWKCTYKGERFPEAARHRHCPTRPALMKPFLFFTLFLCTPALFAAKGNKPAKGDRQAMHAAIEALKAFDKNGNKKIDGDEIAAVQKAFAEAPTGAMKPLDSNKDGKLDEMELRQTGPRGSFAAILKEIDKDKNHKFEGPEIEALRTKFAADPKAFGKIDHNGNGKLDDDEIAKLNERMAGRAQAGARSKPGGKTAPAMPAPKDPPAAEALKPPGRAKRSRRPNRS